MPVKQKHKTAYGFTGAIFSMILCVLGLMNPLDSDARQSGADVNAEDGAGRTLLHRVAATSDHEQYQSMCLILIEAGADVTLKDDSGRLATDIARDEGNHKFAEILSPDQ